MSSELPAIAADYESPDPSLCRQVLATEWPLLAAPVRAVHGRRPIALVGNASVVRGSGLLARLLGWSSGLPPEQHNGPVKVLLERTHSETGERWTRFFGTARPMRSRLRRAGEYVDETIGFTRLRFKYSLEGGSIRWTAVAGRTLGVPWPETWLKGIEASESIRGNQYYFDVRAVLPGIGLLVHYVGTLDVVTP
jgi:hypothetical protein